MDRIVECISCDQGFARKELAHDDDGIYVCRACAKKLRTIKSPERTCPNDETTMERMLAYRFLTLDKCPKCGGVWTDRAEYEIQQKIDQAIQNKNVGEAWIRGKLGV